MVLITDGRFSGATRGFCVGHVSPEAAVLGPIALVEDGDEIILDGKKGIIELLISNDELNVRKKLEIKENDFTSGALEICAKCWFSTFWSGYTSWRKEGKKYILIFSQILS